MHGVVRTDTASSWSQVCKMRAALTKGFGMDGNRGNVNWDSSTGQGNPSLSILVAHYCRGLHRRKVQHHGETATSARAITASTLQKLFLFNLKAEKDGANDDWCGPSLRVCLHAIYTLATVCLLRIDEVLKIQAHDISWEHDDANVPSLVLRLNFRKTHQFGGKVPFIIRLFPAFMIHLCPVRALVRWISRSGITSGFLFRKMNSNNEPILLKSAPMTADFFLQCFRNNLVDILYLHVDEVYAYGTHSFRRGGCQWLSSDLRWPLRQICEYGGWSMEFSHLTIVKYLISWNDDPLLPRSDFFNFDRRPALRCYTCNRSCPCA
ncbi:hypothetical protein BDZ89DRAFT_952957 [Hymenopellis radicata]|nr:hypothetical protein BDZ89DRAFT_952957 [Hymenopellis radicata]